MDDLKPWRRDLVHGEATLVCPWPRRLAARHLRAAVITELAEHLPEDALAPWSQRRPDGSLLQSMPRVMYRSGAPPRVHVWGDEAPRLLKVLDQVCKLRAPDEMVAPVEAVKRRVWQSEIAHTKSRLHTYRLETPLFPCDAANRRRASAQHAGPAGERWWATNVIESAVRNLLAEAGVEDRLAFPIHVCDIDLRVERVRWERPARGTRDERRGVAGTFMVNAAIPDGLAVGAKVSEGFGVLRRMRHVDVTDVDPGRRVRRRRAC